MVVYGGGSLWRALLGDIFTANALANGWVGFVFMAQFSMWMSSVRRILVPIARKISDEDRKEGVW